jgi:phospholipid/cholesterol/gamma-HCH transport system ATP-binding protein
MSGATDNDVTIDIQKLVKHFDGQLVLDELDLQVRRGETLVIIGCSGCGKSVLLKHMIGILKPDRGRVYVNGIDIVPLPDSQLLEVAAKFGMVFQGAALFDSLNVWENVAFSLTEHKSKMTGKQIDERVKYCLNLVGLSGTELKNPAELSGGMRKRVGVARAIAHQPEIILYDEPTTGLDPVTGDTINDLILRAQENLHATSVAVTHDLHSAFKIGDRIALLADGKIVAVGTPHEIWHSDEPRVQRFLRVAGTAVYKD